jgi:glutathione S-transferase
MDMASSFDSALIALTVTCFPYQAVGDPSRGRYLYLLHYALCTVYPLLAPLALQHHKPAAEQDEAMVARNADKFTSVVGPLLAAALGEQDFMMGSDISGVDCAMGKGLYVASRLGLLLLDPFPK